MPSSRILGTISLRAVVEGAKVFGPDNEQIGKRLVPWLGFVCSPSFTETSIHIIRDCHLWHSLADPRQKHCYGVREEWLPQEGHGGPGRCQKQVEEGRDHSYAFHQAELLARVNEFTDYDDRDPASPSTHYRIHLGGISHIYT